MSAQHRGGVAFGTSPPPPPPQPRRGQPQPQVLIARRPDTPIVLPSSSAKIPTSILRRAESPSFGARRTVVLPASPASVEPERKPFTLPATSRVVGEAVVMGPPPPSTRQYAAPFPSTSRAATVAQPERPAAVQDPGVIPAAEPIAPPAEPIVIYETPKETLAELETLRHELVRAKEESARLRAEAGKRQSRDVLGSLLATCSHELDLVENETSRLRQALVRSETLVDRLTEELKDTRERLAEKDELEAIHQETNARLQEKLRSLGHGSSRQSSADSSKELTELQQKYTHLLEYYNQLLEYVEATRGDEQE